MSKIREFLIQYWLILFGTVIGLSVSLLFIYIGFFKTILILIFGTVGGSVGYYIQKKLS
ncbi:DUF2273 domain-containing protein (plasmid) [Carnobacterium maltaromaticum]|uniref:DUF2273 domain-containing protein n=1 Tax=Carnobacterium maltaromaticum TaxID=2751 RepID=UPI00344E6C06